MSDLIERHRKRPWPPLIVAAHASRLIRWRDVALTLLMWLLFGWMLRDGLERLLGPWLEHWGFGDFDSPVDFAAVFEWLRPHVRISVLLIVVLAVAGVATLIRRRRSLDLPEPPPLTLAEEAARAGMDAGDLARARELPNVVVTIDAQGRHFVKAR